MSDLSSTVSRLDSKVHQLETKVTNLEDNVQRAESLVAVSTMTSNLLKKELDRAEQYSRRSCIILDGIKASREDKPSDHFTKVMNVLSKTVPDIASDLDKTHPVGPIKDGKQTMIVRFAKHSSVKKLYKKGLN